MMGYHESEVLRHAFMYPSLLLYDVAGLPNFTLKWYDILFCFQSNIL